MTVELGGRAIGFKARLTSRFNLCVVLQNNPLFRYLNFSDGLFAKFHWKRFNWISLDAFIVNGGLA